jgi:hypothetical protein
VCEAHHIAQFAKAGFRLPNSVTFAFMVYLKVYELYRSKHRKEVILTTSWRCRPNLLSVLKIDRQLLRPLGSAGFRLVETRGADVIVEAP